MIERALLCVHTNQHVESWGHRRAFFGKRRQKLGDVTAKLGAAAAAGLGQKHQQLPERDDAHRVDDLAALASSSVMTSSRLLCARAPKIRAASFASIILE